ncbi:hypothetical protein EV421DRAFT_1792650 [Armillaria borealis]|uniref:SHSP domain-containing protein n=1 Tax=Armillaria borealis TaxID=47425 RepID=A0AA39JNR2_9AGAR|nr:hypothetical protein EV421DRAFT_1792650 [Armillaria borealis]
MVERLSPYDLCMPDAIDCVSSKDENESSSVSSHSASASSTDSSERLIHISVSMSSRNRRAPSPSTRFNVRLPPDIQPEMVTISAKKGDKLKVVADAWHMENNCHCEWLITFPPLDVDMSKVYAKFGGDGLLTIDVCRLRRYS